MVDVDLIGALASQGREKDRPGVAGGDPLLLDGDYVRIGVLPTQIVNVVSLVGAVKSPGPYEYRPGMTVKDILGVDQLTVEAYADRAEIVRTDPVTYQTKVIQFSPKALLEGSEAENHRSPTSRPNCRGEPTTSAKPRPTGRRSEATGLFHH